MSAINMPNNPADGETFIAENGINYVYDLQPTVGWFRPTWQLVQTFGLVIRIILRFSYL